MFKQFIKKWFGIDKVEAENAVMRSMVERHLNAVKSRMTELESHSRLDADMGVRGPCTIILTGVYRGRGYVRFYEVDHTEFKHTVERYKDGRKQGYLRNLDSIPNYPGGSFDFLKP